MFTKIILISSLLALAHSQAQIVYQSEEHGLDGNFEWSYKSSDGSSQQQSGNLKHVGQETAEVIQGSASWVDPEGNQHQLNYVADENGYHPQSADLPAAPEIPAAILRALDWIAAHSHEGNQK
ncbi:unnamed protein product [Ceutorhynchus assimilis]|uniref:Uncharacterized protein n=1 Tax=Ceutorhynchus assimilis TaxID=467358 RepID=A0A9N9MPR9_9CUCU|nr:unnamed protein product [Ceutorhynchus assimilis]